MYYNVGGSRKRYTRMSVPTAPRGAVKKFLLYRTLNAQMPNGGEGGVLNCFDFVLSIVVA